MTPLGPKLSILIVVDERETAVLLEDRLLETPDWNLNIEKAGNGKAALTALETLAFDIVFIDYLLPRTDGLRLLDQIRQLHPKIAVVLMATKGSEKIAVEAMKRGAIDFIGHDDLPLTDLGQLLRRAMEMQILQTENLELRQVNRMKDEFISSVSHELRTPLAVILGYTKTLVDGDLGELSPPQTKAMNAIRKRGDALLEMVNRLLAFKDSAFATQEVLLRPTELTSLLTEHLDGAWPASAERGIRIERRIPEGPIWVLADRDQLKEVVNSLLSNAVKFSGDGTCVRVAVELHSGQETWIQVRDEGRGIQPEVMPRLFDGFVHTDSELTRAVSGLGIGLALTRQIMELHGGRVWLESKGVGKGTTATLVLPLSVPDSPQVVVERPRRLAKKRVLVVEDNKDIVELLRVFLAGFSENLQLTTAYRGDEALELLKERNFDLLVLDLMLPDMNGLELLDRLRHYSKDKDVPVLILSGHKEAARQAMVRGAQDQLMKPFTKQAFLDKVLRLLGMERRTQPR